MPYGVLLRRQQQQWQRHAALAAALGQPRCMSGQGRCSGRGRCSGQGRCGGQEQIATLPGPLQAPGMLLLRYS